MTGNQQDGRMEHSASKERTSGITLLVNWANTQDHWARVLVGAVLDTRRALSEAVVSELYELLLQEKQLLEVEGDPISVPPIEHDGDAGDQEKTLRLTKLSGVANVNALAADQNIGFNTRMTVLYGENGAGKTGYVRILKQLASVRSAEPILPNIGQPGAAGTPVASIDYELEEAPGNYAWGGQEGVQPFTQIDVFDAKEVDLHVDGPLTYIYTPAELAVFKHTHEAIEAVKGMLDKACKAALPTGNPYLNKFSREGALYAKIETLGPTTDLSELEVIANVTDAERAQLALLQERVDALRSGSSDAKLQVAENEQDVFNRLDTAITAAEAFDQGAYARALDLVCDAEKAHTHATQKALSDEAIPGLLKETWRRFIEAGEQYLVEHSQDGYPKDGDACPFCLQDLNQAAIALVRKYRVFCQSDLQDTLDKVREQLRALTETVFATEIEQLALDVEKRIEAEGSKPHASLTAALALLTQFSSLRATISKGQALEATEFAGLTKTVRPLVDARRAALDTLVNGLRTDVGNRKTLLASESVKLRELQDRITLSELLPGVRGHVASAKWNSRGKTLVGRFPALTRSLTATSKLASEKLLNDDFESTFKKECKALCAPVVTLDFPGRKGQPARRKSLTPEHRLSATLSEGEQKVIALADFVAEATLRRSSTPIVLDDPVTSLDYKRLEHVVDRLVQLSETRQVIVFTHNVWFTMELLGRFDKNRKACTYYDVSEDGEVRGVVSPGDSPRLDTWGDKKKRINLMVGRARGEDDRTMREVLIEKGYDDMRGACELVVEQDLLQAVVQSYRRNVMVGNLARLKFEELPEASAKVNEIFARCSRITGAHKQPIETLNVRPSLEDLEKDWKTIQAIHTQFSKATT